MQASHNGSVGNVSAHDGGGAPVQAPRAQSYRIVVREPVADPGLIAGDAQGAGVAVPRVGMDRPRTARPAVNAQRGQPGERTPAAPFRRLPTTPPKAAPRAGQPRGWTGG